MGYGNAGVFTPRSEMTREVPLEDSWDPRCTVSSLGASTWTRYGPA